MMGEFTGKDGGMVVILFCSNKKAAMLERHPDMRILSKDLYTNIVKGDSDETF